MSKIKLEELKVQLQNVADIECREIICNKELVTIVYVDSLCDSTLISDFIIQPLLNYDNKKLLRGVPLDTIAQEVIALGPAGELTSLEDAISHLFSGDVLVFLSSKKVLFCDAKGFPARAISEPVAETAEKGPNESFNESIKDNLSAIRRRLKTPKLKIEGFSMGKESRTAANIIYMEGAAPDQLVSYIRDKINSINTVDYILYLNYIEEALKDKGSAFDTIGYTERPDTAAQKISEGKVVIIIDGTAVVAIAPYFFLENFHSTDDYTMNKISANIARGLRLVSFFLATLLPGLYIAITTHHFRLIPTIFLFKMTIFRAGVPLPTVLELLVMLLFFQIIREGSIRLPQPIGQSLSIVGALILGESAVRAGLASQVTVVVVGIASLSSFLIPKMYKAMFFWDVILVIFSAILGLPGFYIGFVVFIAHIASLNSCGYPFLYPLGTWTTFKYKDVTYRGVYSEISNHIFQRDDKP